LQVKALPDGLEVVLLGDVKFPCQPVSVNVETEEVAGRSRVRTFELRIELALGFVQGRAVVASNELVVNMDGEDEEIVALSARVETGICFGQSGTLRLEPFVKLFVEAAW
jgi:hypothetical protein